MSSSNSVLVLGGTGAMGSHVIEILKNDGFDVYVSSRKERKNDGKITYLLGNAKNDEFISKVCKQKYTAIIDFMNYNIDEFSKERINVLLSSTDQYIFISSARVYADSPLITEESPRLLDVCTDKEYVASNEYAIAKAKEDVLFKSEHKNWTIVRPSLTYAENRLQLGVYEKENWLYRALHGRSIVFSKDLMDKYYTLSYGKNVAEGIAGLVGKQEAIGQAFHIVVDESFQWKEILDIYLNTLEKRTGKRPNVVLTDKCTNLQLPYAKYQVLYARYFNRHFDNSKIRKLVDTSSWVLPKDGLDRCLNAFLDKPQFSSLDWHKEALLDKAAKEWTPLKEIPGKKMKLKYLKWRILG